MSTDTTKLDPVSTAFGMAAAITILFNVALAWAKDAYRPLTILMNRIAGNSWTTQALADLILFVALGLVFWRTHATDESSPNRLIVFLTTAVMISAAGLFAWYAVF